MNVLTTRLSSKYQLTLPKRARQALGVGAGEPLLIVIDGDRVYLEPRPASWTDYMEGLGAEMWASFGGGEAYLEGERDSWQTPPAS